MWNWKPDKLAYSYHGGMYKLTQLLSLNLSTAVLVEHSKNSTELVVKMAFGKDAHANKDLIYVDLVTLSHHLK